MPTARKTCSTSDELREAVARFTERTARKVVARSSYRLTDREALQTVGETGLAVLDAVRRIEQQLAGTAPKPSAKAPPKPSAKAPPKPSAKAPPKPSAKAPPKPSAKAPPEPLAYALRWHDRPHDERQVLRAASDEAAASMTQAMLGSFGPADLFRDGRRLGTSDATGWRPAAPGGRP